MSFDKIFITLLMLLSLISFSFSGGFTRVSKPVAKPTVVKPELMQKDVIKEPAMKTETKVVINETPVKIEEPKVEKSEPMPNPPIKVVQVTIDEFFVYENGRSPKNKYIATGWMGDYGDLRYSDRCAINPYKGQTCIRIKYSARQTQNQGWAGIYWQWPANNWGNLGKKGHDLTEYDQLSFYAKGEKGGEIVNEFIVGGIEGPTQDSMIDTSKDTIGPIKLTKKWKKYIIDLKDNFTNEKLDLSNIMGGFAFSVSTNNNPEGFTIYIDEIVFEKNK